MDTTHDVVVHMILKGTDQLCMLGKLHMAPITLTVMGAVLSQNSLLKVALVQLTIAKVVVATGMTRSTAVDKSTVF